MNRMERFTKRARHALSLAQEATTTLHHNAIDTEHLLLGLVREDAGVAGTVLRELGLNRKQVEELVKELSAASQGEVSSPELSPDVKRALEKAVAQANKLGHNYVGTEHLLLGLLEQKNSTAMTILDRLGITAQQVRQYTMTKLEVTEDDRSRGTSTFTYPLSDERRRVLDMVDEGKITALEGAELLKSLQIVAAPFPMGTNWVQQLLPLGNKPIDQLQNRVLRLVIRKGDKTEFELRHSMRQLNGDYLLLLNRFYSGEIGKIMDFKGDDDKTIDLYIDEADDEENTGEG
jgi:hypothetical protein